MKSRDRTRIHIDFDPTKQRMRGRTLHGNIEFDAPYISQVTDNLWQGGCADGLYLPSHIRHVVSLYPWERYSHRHRLDSMLEIPMYDDAQSPVNRQQVLSIAYWVNDCRQRGDVLVHCFPTGTLVGGRMPTPIETAEVVTGHDGVEHKVLGRSARPYDGDLVVLRSTGALPLRCTPEHPIQIVRPYRFPGGFVSKPGFASQERVSTVVGHYQTQPIWVDAKDVEAGDFLVTPKPDFSGEGDSPEWARPFGVNAKVVGRLEPDADTAWMLGLFAADGGVMGSNSIGFTMSPTDDVERLVTVWERLGLRAAVRDYGAYRRVTVNSAVVSDSFRQWFGKSNEKRFPAFVFHGWPIEHIVAGYVAGDGHVSASHRGQITALTISPVLVEQLRSMLVSLGESPVVGMHKRPSGYPNAKPAYRLHWAPGAWQRHTAWWRGMYLMPVTSVGTEHYTGMVHNIEVAEAETYTVGGAIVHNCQAGLNRSGLIAGLALVLEGMHPAEAVQRLRDARSPAVLCNPLFAQWLLEFDLKDSVLVDLQIP